MCVPLGGDGPFSVHATMKAFRNYAGKGKRKLIQHWINNNFIPCQKTRLVSYTPHTQMSACLTRNNGSRVLDENNFFHHKK